MAETYDQREDLHAERKRAAGSESNVERLVMCNQCNKYKNMLEDVVNELDLSEAAIAEHGLLGTPPAELVRLILQQKDREISALRAGIKVLHT